MPAAIGLVDLGILLALGVLIGLRFGYSYSLGRVLLLTSALLGSIRLPGFLGGGRVLGFAADAILKADHAIMHALGRGIEDMQAAWNEALSYTAQAFHWIGKEIASLSHDAAQAIEHVRVTQVTNVYRKVNPGLAARVGALAAAVATLKHAVLHRVEGATRVVVHEVKVVTHAISVPDVGALPRTVPRVGQLEREIADGLARLRDYAKRFAPAAAVGTVAFVLARLGMTWARCSRVNKVGKRICGMNDSALDNLLAGTLLVVGTVSLVEFAKGMQGVMDEIEPPVRAFWRATT